MEPERVHEQVILAGFGGQGIMLAGKLLAQTAMCAGHEVTYMPAYGAEVRGGTANCMVIISDRPIACPVVARPDAVIVMNKASLSKFGPRVGSRGLVVVNSSMITDQPQLDPCVDVVQIPADDLAIELGNAKAANMIALGAYLGMRGQFSAENAGKALKDVLARRYHHMIELNCEALRQGEAFVAGSRGAMSQGLFQGG